MAKTKPASMRSRRPARSSRKPSRDDPRQAMESGEPSISGRSHGRLISQDEPVKTSRGKRRGSRDTIGEDFESGRNDAAA